MTRLRIGATQQVSRRMCNEDLDVVPENGTTPSTAQVLRVPGDQDFGASALQQESADCSGLPTTEAEAPKPQQDYATRRSLTQPVTLKLEELAPLADNYAALGKALAQAGDLYRNTPYAGGLLLASGEPNVAPRSTVNSKGLAASVVDRSRIEVWKDGKLKGNSIPSKDLHEVRCREAFVRFRAHRARSQQRRLRAARPARRLHAPRRAAP